MPYNTVKCCRYLITFSYFVCNSQLIANVFKPNRKSSSTGMFYRSTDNCGPTVMYTDNYEPIATYTDNNTDKCGPIVRYINNYLQFGMYTDNCEPMNV